MATRYTLTFTSNPAAQRVQGASLFFAQDDTHAIAISTAMAAFFQTDCREFLNRTSYFVQNTNPNIVGSVDYRIQMLASDGTLFNIFVPHIAETVTPATIEAAVLGSAGGIPAQNSAGHPVTSVVQVRPLKKH